MSRRRPPGFCAAALLLGIGLGGCAPTLPPHDYSAYRGHMPRSVLVLPPLNNTTEVDASYVYLSTVTRPLAEAGYYVFPVAVVDNFMKENGLPTPTEMNAVSLDKIRAVFGADAVLYTQIEEWGQKYTVLASTTVVKAHARLVDVRTGATLWEGTANAAQGSGNSGGGILGMVVAAAVGQIVGSSTDQAHNLSGVATHTMIFDTRNGLLSGPYHPDYATDPRGR
ncbi:MAG: DUF799 family lipoprotein [Deferrisomatales bacterium]|nr:DUF799 family lipoprotein [Deferrisomatales bacterium]